MKRKLALLLAVVMAMTLLPISSVFAATENRLTKTATVVPENSLMYEDTTTPATVGLAAAHTRANVDNGSKIEYVVDGTYLVIRAKDAINAGESVRLTLDNAVWFFRGLPTATFAAYTTGAGVANWAAAKPFSATEYPATSFYVPATSATEKWEAGTIGGSVANGNTATYDTGLGQFFLSNTGVANNKETRGTYFRAGVASGAGQNTDIAYTLDVTSLDREAVLTIRQDMRGGTINDEIKIPIVCRTTAKADVKLYVDPQTANTNISTGVNYLIAIAGGGDTTTSVNDPKTARDTFDIDKLIIAETRINSVSGTSSFEVQLPSGFEFQNPTDYVSPLRVSTERGLGWSRYSVNAAGAITGTVSQFGIGTMATYNNLTGAMNSVIPAIGAAGTASIGDWDWDWKRGSDGDIDRSTLIFTCYNLRPSTDLNGKIVIEGLKYSAEDGAPWGDIQASIRPVYGNYDSNGHYGSYATWYLANDAASLATLYATTMTRAADWPTSQSFKAGTRVDWTISLRAITTVPTLVNGRYESASPASARDDYHKTARVEFKENSTNAWWASRQTEFTLPVGVKYRKVEIVKTDKFDKAVLGASWEGKFKKVFENDGTRHDYVKVDGNTMYWYDLRISQNEKGLVEFDTWVSIESGFEGDVVLSVGGTGVPAQGDNNTVPSAVIAKQITPITVTTKSSDIKIGYQYQETQDIMITETKAGNLLRGKEMKVSVTDMISSDMVFADDVKVEVEPGGDLKIDDVVLNKVTSAAADNVFNSNGDAMRFKIKAQSTKPSTILISNVSVKVNRDVPETNRKPYKVVVWGPAVAENYGNPDKYPNLDKFRTPGVMADYLKVISVANDKIGVFSAQVKVTIGETYYTKNGVPVEMDAAAYISTASNSTMVPVRFVANALGVPDEQVLWDDANKTVTVLTTSKVVQFKVGSSTQLINGAAVTMYSPDQKAVSPEIVADRCYVPFRALGDAFGIVVAWDEATQTAIYNPDGVVGNTESVNEEPVATEQSAAQ